MAPPSRLEGFREGRGWGRIPPVLLHGGAIPLRSRGEFMRTLYKYSDLFPVDYFDKPTIKISATEFLNDPFEYSASEDIFHSIENYLKKESASDENIKRFKKVLKDKAVPMMLAYNGIISLSETPRNSLMWAHYAKQHNGICIGYKSNFLQHIEKSEEFQIVINKPQKVNYDNLRFERDYNYSDIYSIETEAVTQHLLKKSDEWIYEKEHRLIIPYAKANTLKILSDTPKVDHIHSVLTYHIGDTGYKIGQSFQHTINAALNKGYLTSTDTKNQYIINHDKVGSTRIFLLQASKDCLFLIDISPDSIESIYFGCKLTKDIIKPYFEKLYGKYKMYHFTLSKDRFELVPELLMPDMF